MGNQVTLETSGPYVASLTDTAATDRALGGGKGANLARLITAGLPVPEGFCVTTLAYRHVIDDESIQELIRDLSDIDPSDAAAIANAGATLRTRIESCTVPGEIRDAIETALGEIKSGPDEAFAVRSSATAEDRPDASFAGQQETFLNIQGTEDVVDCVRSCMASLFTNRAIAYRARNGVSHEDVALAVVVQRMLDPDVSGILFTADPISGNRHVTAIEAGLGLGEAFVSGQIAADSIRVDTRTAEILSYEVGAQQIAMRPRSEGGIETVELSGDGRTTRALTDGQIRTMVGLGTRIQELFGHPQDIEWCLEDGRFYVVQSRPITTLFPVPSPEPADDRLHVYYSVGHAQAFPEAMPPLVRDVWLTYTRSALAVFGMGTDAGIGVEAGGRAYVDITPLLRMDFLRNDIPALLSEVSEPMSAAVEDLLRRRGDEFRTERTLRETVGVLPTLAGTAWKRVQALPFISQTMGGFVGAFVREPNPPEYEEALWIEWGREIASRITCRDTLVERVQASFDLFGTADAVTVTTFPRTGPLFAALVVDGWLRERFPDAQADVNAVGRGFPHELVTRINLGLGDLADVARDHPEVADALRRGSSLDEIQSVAGGAAFQDAFDEYLDEFGHRATGELDLSRPRWRENPSWLLATVRANLEHGEKGTHREHVQQMEREALAAAERLEQRANRGLLGPVRRRLVRRLIRTYRGYIQTREYPKQGAAYLFAAWREVLCDAGEELVAMGQLSSVDDVWFLRKDELFAALEGKQIDVDLTARRTEFERLASMNAPPVLTSEGEAPSPNVDREGVPEGALVGTGVSGGVVEGVAHVIRDPTEETIEQGEVLVAPSSDPGWTPLFLNAAGMVVEVGGRMSHGALVAREYGLPAVVSVPEATRRIQTGQKVRVDGTKGVVEIIE